MKLNKVYPSASVSCIECGQELPTGSLFRWTANPGNSRHGKGLCILRADGQHGCGWNDLSDDDREIAQARISGHFTVTKTVEPKGVTRPTPDAPTPATNGTGLDLLGMIAGAVTPLVASQVAETIKDQALVDEDRVLDLVEQALEATSQRIEIRKWDGTKTKLEGLHHKTFPQIIKIAYNTTKSGMRRNLWLYGPSGTGKSVMARKIADAMAVPFYYISLNPQSSASRIEGFTTPHGEYVMTLFRQAYQDGGVFLADEADNAAPNLWTSLNNALDSDIGSFPDGIVQRHADFLFIAAANTNGRGSADYGSRMRIDKATLTRFVMLYIDYDPQLELAVTKMENPHAEPLWDWFQKARRWAKDHNRDLYSELHSRALYDAAGLLRDGCFASPEQALESTCWKYSIDETSIRALYSAVPLPTQNLACG